MPERKPGTVGAVAMAALAAISHHRNTISIYAAVRGDGILFNGQDQFLANIHLPARFDTDTHGRDGFADNAARQREAALTDREEQNHELAKPDRVRMREILRSLGEHVGYPLEFVTGTRFL
jgi:hypothetical protein